MLAGGGLLKAACNSRLWCPAACGACSPGYLAPGSALHMKRHSGFGHLGGVHLCRQAQWPRCSLSVPVSLSLFPLQSHIHQSAEAFCFLPNCIPHLGLDWSLDPNNFMPGLLTPCWSPSLQPLPNSALITLSLPSRAPTCFLNQMKTLKLPAPSTSPA